MFEVKNLLQVSFVQVQVFHVHFLRLLSHLLIRSHELLLFFLLTRQLRVLHLEFSNRLPERWDFHRTPNRLRFRFFFLRDKRIVLRLKSFLFLPDLNQLFIQLLHTYNEFLTIAFDICHPLQRLAQLLRILWSRRRRRRCRRHHHLPRAIKILIPQARNLMQQHDLLALQIFEFSLQVILRISSLQIRLNQQLLRFLNALAMHIPNLIPRSQLLRQQLAIQSPLFFF